MYCLLLLEFSNKRYRFESFFCNSCYDVLMMSINIDSIVILNIHDVDYRCIIVRISKREAINFINECWFEWKFCIIIKLKTIFYIVQKMNKEVIMLSNIEIGKRNSHCSKYTINTKIFHNDKLITSGKVLFNKKRFKYIIG